MKDTTIKKLIAREDARQTETINLIASENYISEDVAAALASSFGNKYAEGYPGARYYEGNEIVDKMELLCQTRAREVFGLEAPREDGTLRQAQGGWHVNVQALSGSPANLAVLSAVLNPGDTILAMDLSHGGHLSHGYKVSLTGKLYNQISYGVDQKTGLIDYRAVEKLALEHKPNIIIAGASAYSRTIDFKKFGAIAKKVGALLLCDIAHIAGLVAVGVHPSPFPYADIVTTTTHKTLRGPRGALIFANTGSRVAAAGGIDLAKKINSAVFPGIQGGPHMNQIAAIAVALFEASKPAFTKYAQQVVKNAAAFPDELKRLGWNIVSNGTDNHLFMVDVFGTIGVDGDAAAKALASQGIICNKNMIPFDTRKPASPSGIRFGTPAQTTRGWKEKDFIVLAHKINEILRSLV